MGVALTNEAISFTAAKTVEVVQEPKMSPNEHEVILHSEYSAVSPGTELLLYRGELPAQDVPSETDTMNTTCANYPIRFGYQVVGTVEHIGDKVPEHFKGNRVAAFAPHQRYHAVRASCIKPIPEDIPSRDAVLFANVETAVNIVMDARPMIGERVLVIGQGVVGLLTATLLETFPLSSLITLDENSERVSFARRMGLRAFSPSAYEESREQDAGVHDVPNTPDIIIELSGNPKALQTALTLAGYQTRIVIGSWYGTKEASIALGGSFHRNRVSIVSSQVSSINPAYAGRWNKTRRFESVWQVVRLIRPSRFITHEAPLADAPTLYKKLDAGGHDMIQPVFYYGAGE